MVNVWLCHNSQNSLLHQPTGAVRCSVDVILTLTREITIICTFNSFMHPNVVKVKYSRSNFTVSKLHIFLTSPKMVEHFQCFLLLIFYNYLNFALWALEEPPASVHLGPQINVSFSLGSCFPADAQRGGVSHVTCPAHEWKGPQLSRRTSDQFLGLETRDKCLHLVFASVHVGECGSWKYMNKVT